MSRRPASENGSQGIPEATVARLPVYLRTLYALADRGIATVVERGTRLSGRGKFQPSSARTCPTWVPTAPAASAMTSTTSLYQAIQGTRPDPGLAGRHRRRRQSGPGARQLPGLRVPRVPDRRAAARLPTPGVVGSVIAGHVVRERAGSIESVVTGHEVAIGVIATPAGSAQDVCDRLVAAGVTSILNFAPVVLSVPSGVDVRKVDLSIELQILAFHAQRRAVVRVGGETGTRLGSAPGPAAGRTRVRPHGGHDGGDGP